MSQIKQCEAQRGSRIEDQGLRFEDRGSRIEDWGSRIEAFSAAVLQVSLCKALQARLAHLGCVALRAVHWPSLLLCCHFLPGAASATTGSCPQTTTSDTPLTPPPPCAGEKQNNAASVITDYYRPSEDAQVLHISTTGLRPRPQHQQTPAHRVEKPIETGWYRWILKLRPPENASEDINWHQLLPVNSASFLTAHTATTPPTPLEPSYDGNLSKTHNWEWGESKKVAFCK